MNFYECEEPLATPSEACREFARNIGAERPEQPWILTGRDTWERNPFYHGPPVPDPESAIYAELDELQAASEPDTIQPQPEPEPESEPFTVF